MESTHPLADILTGKSNTDQISLSQVVEGYLRYYAADSSHTARAKQLDLKKFLTNLARQQGLSRPEKLTVQHFNTSAVKRFVEDLLAQGEAPATVSRRLATIKHMGRSLAERVPGFSNPAREVKAPRVEALKPHSLSTNEVEVVRDIALERQDERQSFNRFRNQVLFEFLIETGLRAEEVRMLRKGQLDEDFEWVKSVRTKGRRYRNVYIASTIRPLLKRYLEQRQEQLKRFFPKLSVSLDKKLPFFISSYGADPKEPDSFLMGAKSIWRAINELSSQTHLHPHLLRHSFAIELLDSSRDVRLVSQALGHSDVRITMRYTERSDQQMAAAIEEKHSKKP